MSYGMYISAAGADAQSRRLEILSNNLANVDTPGFKRELAIPRERLNVHGGAIALSHPLAASGARITAHLLHALRAGGKRYGLGTACIGGGQGVAVIIENLS